MTISLPTAVGRVPEECSPLPKESRSCEARAKDDPTFLDRQHIYNSDDGTHNTTFRALLTGLEESISRFE